MKDKIDEISRARIEKQVGNYSEQLRKAWEDIAKLLKLFKLVAMNIHLNAIYFENSLGKKIIYYLGSKIDHNDIIRLLDDATRHIMTVTDTKP